MYKYCLCTVEDISIQMRGFFFWVVIFIMSRRGRNSPLNESAAPK